MSMSDPLEPFNTADEAQVKKRQKLAALRDQERDQALKQMLQTRGGRSWIWSVLARANIFKTSMVYGDPHATSFNEGMRNAGIAMLADVMRVEAAAFPLMQREANEDFGG